MYKFTNGIVVFDKQTKDDFLRAGFTLEKQESDVQPIKGQINIDDAINEVIKEENENSKNNRIIDKKPRTSKTISE